MKKGKLIIFEGIDGCGKTTQINLVYNKLFEMGYDVILTREPGGTLLGEKIRELLLDVDNTIDTITEAYLFASSRAAHNAQIVEWINQGKIVLCDRHLMSSLVYQNKYIASQVNKIAMDILDIDNIEQNILYFDMSYDTYKERVNIRTKERELDRIENYLNEGSTKNYLDEYKIQAIEFKAHQIDANRSIDEIHERVMETIKEIIK